MPRISCVCIMIAFHSTVSAKAWDKVEERIAWVEATAKRYNACFGRLQFILCSDEELREMNQRYLLHDYETDVLTFDLSKAGTNHTDGEVYISIDRIEDQARQYGVPSEEELDRVLIHGVLHLLGFDDKEAEDKVKMTGAEDEALKLRPWNG